LVGGHGAEGVAVDRDEEAARGAPHQSISTGVGAGATAASSECIIGSISY
jgi:hypothetical protein